MVDPSTAPLVEVIGHLALAFGIGALVGLEREQSQSSGTFAGSRTFPLIALHGTLVAALLVAILGAMTMHSARSATVAIVVGFVSSTATTGTSRSDRTARVASRPVNRPCRQRAPRVKRGRGTTAPRR